MRAASLVKVLGLTCGLAAAFINGRALAAATHGANDDDTPPLPRWAAFAYGIEWFDQDQHYGNSYSGRAISEASELSAKDAAIRACAFETCEIKVYVQTGCIGLAHGFDQDGLEWTGFAAARFDATSGATIGEAKRNARLLAGETAVEGCGGGTLNRDCQVKEAYCTWDVAGDSSVAAIQRWVDEMGGERSDGVYTTLLYLSRAAMPVLANSGLTSDQAQCVISGYWARVEQVATQCHITVDQLDTIYSKANLLSQ